MKIRDVITETDDGRSNKAARISRSASQAEKQFLNAEKGDGRTDDTAHLLAKVRDMYGVDLVDDFVDFIEEPNGKHGTDKEQSLLSTDNRKNTG